jgi:hypothetical protein
MAANSTKSAGELESHVVAVRMRVVGSGNLNLSLESLDAVKTSSLIPISMLEQTNIEPTRLANFQSQRIRLVVQNDLTNGCSWFRINRIILFAKPVAVEYPM